MSYYDRSQRPISGRYVSPFDNMLDSFNRFNEAFYDAMMPRFSERMYDRPFIERYPYDRAYADRHYYERPEKLQEKDIEKLPEKRGQEMVEETTQKSQITPKPEERDWRLHPFTANLLERPVTEALRTFDDPFFKSNWNSYATVDRAHRLFDEMIDKGKPDIHMTKEDELLKVPEAFQDVYHEFGEKGGKVTGTSYQTSNITKDGKTVTVVRKSKLHPDGSISTKVSQHFDDGTGHTDTKSRKKTINFKSGAITHTEKDRPALKTEKSPSTLKSTDSEKSTEKTVKAQESVLQAPN